MQRVDIRIPFACTGSGFGQPVPLLDQLFQVVVHVLLELADRLGAESVGDGFAFTGVLGAVSRVEKAALDAHEGVVVITVYQTKVKKDFST